MSATVATAKADLRSGLRRRRRGLPDRDVRSAAITRNLRALAVLTAASRVMAYRSLPGEPDTELLLAWCRAEGKDIMVPEDGPEPSWPDVVIVPGVAFTRVGERLGQGGGWYDRFLPRTCTGCVTIGVGFDFQLLESVPVETHDVRLHGVVTDAGVWWATEMRTR